jgi:orotidine-5'-phosphate decarboxylase
MKNLIMHTPSLVVALDFPGSDESLAFLKKMPEDNSGKLWIKIGLELFVASGPSLLHDVQEKFPYPIVLDLKFHDIPNTVKGATHSAVRWGVQMLNLHAAGGEAMAHGALAGREEAMKQDTSLVRPYIIAVTVLTSQGGDPDALTQEVIKQSLAVKSWGLDGVVCSGREAKAVKDACGKDFICLCPGIRPASSSVDDQARVCTPTQAVQAGADFLVIGRPITKAPDPAATCREILDEIARASSSM